MRIQDAILYGSKRGSGSGPTPSGSIEISENGTYDVTDKAEAVVDVEPDLTTKQITQNGTYQASSDNADGYSAVTVAVPQPSGTKQVSISQNGTTTEDVEDYENAQITVNVQPNLTTKNITQNGTYAASGDSADGYSSVTVNVSGGASNEDAIIDGSLSGVYVNNSATKVRENVFTSYTNISSVNFLSATTLDSNAFSNCNNLEDANFPLVTSINGSCFMNCSKLVNVNFPELKNMWNGQNFMNCTSIVSLIFPKLESILNNNIFRGCSKLVTFDCSKLAGIMPYCFTNCSALTQLILRNNNLVTLYNTSAFNNTPIASGTGYIYVPSALVDSYKAATNWSTYAAQFRALEDYTVDGTTTGDLDPTKI